MNRVHRWLCRSGWWRRTVENSLLPWVLKDIELGQNVLEVGPGPGLTTDVLRNRVPRLTCVEIDERLADSLSQRMAGSNVTVQRGDATAMSFPDASFDGAVSFTMLHHVPSAELQDRLLAEVARVLRPNAVFAGSDSRYSRIFGALHLFDTMVLVDPESLPRRLEAAGFKDVRIDVAKSAFRFRARRA